MRNNSYLFFMIFCRKLLGEVFFSEAVFGESAALHHVFMNISFDNHNKMIMETHIHSSEKK